MSKITNNNFILHIIRIEAWARIRLYVWMHNVFVYIEERIANLQGIETEFSR